MTKKIAVTSLLIMAALLLMPLAALADGGVTANISSIRPDGFPHVITEVELASDQDTQLLGLDTGDFQVYENGARVTGIDAYAVYQSPKPLYIILLMDASGTMAGTPIAQAKEAAKVLIGGMRGIDRMAVIGFSTEVGKFNGFTGDRRLLSAQIDGLEIVSDTSIYDALVQSAPALRGIDGSRAVILLTDGKDNASKATLEQAIEPLVQEKIPVYAIGLGDHLDAPILERIGSATGGQTYKAPAPSDLERVFRQISNQLRNRYVVSYDSAVLDPAGTPVTIKVVAKVGGQTVEAKAQYLVPAVSGSETGATQLKEVKPEARDPLPQWWPMAAGGLSALGSGVFFFGLVISATHGAVERRMRRFVSPFITPGVSPDLPSPLSQLIAPIVNTVGGFVERVTPRTVVEKTAKNLIKAGNPLLWGVRQFLAAKFACGVVLGVLAYLLFGRSLLYGLLMAVLGFLLPGIWLGLRISARRNEIIRALPDALDLLTISVEAGLSFTGAMLEVCRRWDSPLTREFSIALSEMKMGKSRKESLQALARRVDIPEVSIFVGSLIQSDQLGMSIAKTLAVQAEQMRIKRRQRAEEMAHKAAIKMLFPLVFLIFPALFVVILGPSIPLFTSVFGR